MRMQAWSLTRRRLTNFLREKVARDFANDPLVQILVLSSGEFRVSINTADERTRSFRVKVVEEK